MTNKLDTSIETRLRAVARSLRRYVLIEGAASLAAFLLIVCSLQLAIDYGTRGLQWSMRAASLGLIVAGSVVLLWRRIISPLLVPIGLAEVANLIERRYPKTLSTLISAVRFSQGEVGPAGSNSPSLVASVVREGSEQARSLDFGAVLDPTRAKRAGLVLLGVMAMSTIALVRSPETMSLWFMRNVLLQDIDWPKRTHLLVDLEGDALIGARGDDFIVQAHAQGVQPREVEIVFETVSGRRGREVMVTVGGRDAQSYRYTLKNAQEDFSFYLVGGDDQTESFDARLIDRPKVVWSEIQVTPPAYARLEAYTLPDGQRSARVLPGSDIVLRAKTNKPVVEATLMAGRDKIRPASIEGDGLSVGFRPMSTHTYHLALRDEVGFDNRRPVRFSFRATPDEPPRVRMKLPGAGDMITAQAVLDIELEFTDTYGLASADLFYVLSREGTAEESIPLRAFKPALSTYTPSIQWPVASVGVETGETITLHAEATDYNDITEPGSAESPPMTLRVVSREELLSELARREQEYRADFERLIDAQEQVRRGLLTVLTQTQEGIDAAAMAANLSPLERRQRTIAGSINVIRQQFEQILDELRVSQLDNQDERERLGSGIIEPLTRLAKRDLVAAADRVRRWSRDASSQVAADVDPEQVAILSQMRAIRARMIQWEGYQEVIGMLRDIMRLQQALREETKRAFEIQTGDVFDEN